MAKPSQDSRRRTIEVIDWIEWTGYPNPKNIDTLENLVRMITDLAPQLKKPVFLASVKELTTTIQKIKMRLQKEGEIPTRQYTRWNEELVVFKENLISDLASMETSSP
ncbi:MAG: hypothetical protein ACHQT8_01795 [Chlamydiales bacterium]